MLHLQSKGLYEFNLNIKCPLTKDIASLINDWITSKSSNLKHLTIQAVEIDERAMEEFTKSIPSARSKLDEFILLTEYRHNNRVQKQIEILYNKLKLMNVNKLHVCVVGHMLKAKSQFRFYSNNR